MTYSSDSRAVWFRWNVGRWLADGVDQEETMEKILSNVQKGTSPVLCHGLIILLAGAPFG